MGRIELEQEPGHFISGTRARWLLQARRARLTAGGKLQLISCEREGKPAREAGERTQWSAYSSSGARNFSGTRWLAGYHMNGDAVNHG